MCAAQSNQASFGYSWGFADNSRQESVVELSPNVNYTVSEAVPYLQLPDGSLAVQKDLKGAITTHTNKGVLRRMIVVNEPFQGGTQRVITTGGTTVVKKQEQQIISINCDKNYQTDQTHGLTNGIIDTKTSFLTTSSGKPHFSPLGPIHLTAEECNEILMKRALAASQQSHTTITTSEGQSTGDILPGISVQVQKVIQGLEDTEDSQATSSTHCKLEPVLEISPKAEIQEISEHSEGGQGTVKERPYSCEECGKSFLLKHHLTTHARVHTGERPHICVHCGKSFAHKHCLNTHLLLHSTDRPYQCSECKKSFTLKHHLLTHSRVHSRDRPFICPECGRAFPLKRHLVTHSKFHAGERPYVCEECGESFAQENHLIMHSRFHGSLNPFVCQDCGATFPRKFQLVNHGRIHGKVPHSCTLCGKEFLQKRTLISHMRIHTGDQPYPCTGCGDGFQSKAELNQHIRNVHGGINPNASNTTVLTTNTIVTTSPQQTTNVQIAQQAQHHHQQQHHAQQQQHQQHQQQQHQTITVVTNPNITVSSGNDNGSRPQYACRECGSAFNSREALALHLRLHTGDKSLMTDLCALTAALPGHFLNTTNLSQNNQTVVTSNAVPVQIISANGQVVSQAAMIQAQPQQQQQTVVAAVQQAPAQSHIPKPKTHFCASCGKGFAAKHGLLQHNRRHPNGACTLRTHVCECGKAFFQKNHLMLHQRQHLETKPNVSHQSQESIQQQQNQQITQQVQQQNQSQQHAMSRDVIINAQPLHVQVLQGTNPSQMIKYEINIPQEGQTIE